MKDEILYSASNSDAMSEDIRELAKAFCIARMSFAKTGREARNDFGKYNYSEIGDIYNAVVPHLCANNIIIWHFIHSTPERVLLETRLIHSITGQWVRDIRPVHSEKPGNQSFGSANTYAKKNAVLSLCGIGQEDDDCAKEEKHIQENDSKNSNTVNKKDVQLISDNEYNMINNMCADLENESNILGGIYKGKNINSLRDLPKSEFDSVVDYIIKHGKLYV